MNTEGSSIEITNSNALEVKVDKKLLSSKKLGIVEVPIPVPILVPPYVIIIPIPFIEQLSLYTLPFTLGAKMKLQLAPIFYTTIGAHYINNQWINTSTASFKPANFTQFCNKDFFISGGFNSDLTLIDPAYELLPFGSDFLKFSIEAPAKVTLTVQTNSPNYSLKGQLQVNGNMEAKIWTANQQKVSIGTTLYEIKIAEGDWVTCGDTLSLTTDSASSITQTSAISGGNITDSGGAPITARGVCWSTSPNPVIDNNQNITSDGIGIGNFTSNLTGLTTNTTYHIRAYATNNNGTAYGNDVSFTTVQGLDQSGWDGYYVYDSLPNGLQTGMHMGIQLNVNADSAFWPVNDSSYVIQLGTPDLVYGAIYFATIASNSSTINWGYSGQEQGGNLFFTFPEPWSISGNTIMGKGFYFDNDGNKVNVTFHFVRI